MNVLLALGADPLVTAHGGALPVDEADAPGVVALLRAAMGGGGDGGGDGAAAG